MDKRRVTVSRLLLGLAIAMPVITLGFWGLSLLPDEPEFAIGRQVFGNIPEAADHPVLRRGRPGPGRRRLLLLTAGAQLGAGGQGAPPGDVGPAGQGVPARRDHGLGPRGPGGRSAPRHDLLRVRRALPGHGHPGTGPPAAQQPQVPRGRLLPGLLVRHRRRRRWCSSPGWSARRCAATCSRRCGCGPRPSRRTPGSCCSCSSSAPPACSPRPPASAWKAARTTRCGPSPAGTSPTCSPRARSGWPTR